MRLIYDVCYRIFFALKRIRKRFRYLERPIRQYEYYFGLLLNRKFIPWLEKHPIRWGLNTKSKKEQYVVSLTSFPARIEYVHIAIETLLRQKYKPDAVVLWLADSQFPERKLPQKLTQLENRGLTIRWCDDLRSHKKYFYAFQEYPDANIILADDDLFYPADTVKKLVQLHNKYPKDIIAVSAQIIGPEINSLPSVWTGAGGREKYIHSVRAQAFTGAGSLFPAKWHPKELFDKEKAMTLAGTADDLWLKAMSLLAGVKTTLVYPTRGFPVSVEIKNNVTLFQTNGTHGKNTNDKVWAALVAKYELNQYEFEK